MDIGHAPEPSNSVCLRGRCSDRFYSLCSAMTYLTLRKKQLRIFICTQTTQPSTLLAPTPDTVATILNTSLKRLSDWCHLNLLTPHPEKTEFMLIGGRNFIGPLQEIRFGSTYIKQVFSTRCLGIEIDCPPQVGYPRHWCNYIIFTKVKSFKILLLFTNSS